MVENFLLATGRHPASGFLQNRRGDTRTPGRASRLRPERLRACAFVLLTLVLLLACAPCATAQEGPLIPLLTPRLHREDPHQLLRQANEAADQGDADNAWQLLTRAINSADLDQCNLAAAHVRRGRLSLDKNDPGQAQADFRRAVELAPGPSRALSWRALAWLALAKPEPALRDAGQALKLTPHDPLAHFASGRALLALGRHGEALAALNEAIRLAPDLGPAYADRALALMGLGLGAQAEIDDGTARTLPQRLPGLTKKEELLQDDVFFLKNDCKSPDVP